MKKIVCALMMLVLAAALAGCVEKITQGEVVDKQFTPAHTDIRIVPIVRSNGKTTTVTPVRFFYYYPDTYEITISGADKNGNQQKAVYRVTKEVFDTVEMGAEFIYDKDMQPDEPEYRRERSN